MAIAVGEFNRFLPTSDDRGQPTTFHSGRHQSACVVRLPPGVESEPPVERDARRLQVRRAPPARVLNPLYTLEDTSEKRALSALAQQSVTPGRCLAAPEAPRTRRPDR